VYTVLGYDLHHLPTSVEDIYKVHAARTQDVELSTPTSIAGEPSHFPDKYTLILEQPLINMMSRNHSYCLSIQLEASLNLCSKWQRLLKSDGINLGWNTKLSHKMAPFPLSSGLFFQKKIDYGKSLSISSQLESLGRKSHAGWKLTYVDGNR
jgi:hypothetical protein